MGYSSLCDPPQRLHKALHRFHLSVCLSAKIRKRKNFKFGGAMTRTRVTVVQI